MTVIEFLELDTVLSLHDAASAAFGGNPGLRDGGLLESAMLRAPNKLTYAELGPLDLFTFAAAYAFRIC